MRDAPLRLARPLLNQASRVAASLRHHGAVLSLRRAEHPLRRLDAVPLRARFSDGAARGGRLLRGAALGAVRDRSGGEALGAGRRRAQRRALAARFAARRRAKGGVAVRQRLAERDCVRRRGDGGDARRRRTRARRRRAPLVGRIAAGAAHRRRRQRHRVSGARGVPLAPHAARDGRVVAARRRRRGLRRAGAPGDALRRRGALRRRAARGA